MIFCARPWGRIPQHGGVQSATDLASARRAHLAEGDGIACVLRAQASRETRCRDPARRRLEGRHRQRRRCGRQANPPDGSNRHTHPVATVPAGPHPILTALPLPQNKGRIVVDQTTEVFDWPGVWAIGDCAAIKQVDGNISPPTAQHALRQAKTCAENIVASYRGGQKNTLASPNLENLDRSAGARRSRKFSVFDFVAWLLWRGVYVTRLQGFDGQLRLMADWILVSSCHAISRNFGCFTKRQYTASILKREKPSSRTVILATSLLYYQGRGECRARGAPLAKLHSGDVFGEAALIPTSHAMRQSALPHRSIRSLCRARLSRNCSCICRD